LIKQISISESFSNKIAFTDYYPNRQNYFSLFIHYFEDTPIVYDTLGEIMDLILTFLNQHKDVSKDKLLSFMNDLNWISAGKLRNLPLNNQGISLGLVLVNDNQVRALRYGRILMARVINSKIESLGPKWDNFSIKSLDNLSLLGLLSEDKYPELFEFELKNNEQFIVLESDAVEKYQQSLKLSETFNPDYFIYQILECHRKESKKKLLRLI
jgi:hypothetical protein